MKKKLLLFLSAALLGTAISAVGQQGQRPPDNGNRDDKKHPPGPIVKAPKPGENKNPGDKKPPRNRP